MSMRRKKKIMRRENEYEKSREDKDERREWELEERMRNDKCTDEHGKCGWEKKMWMRGENVDERRKRGWEERMRMKEGKWEWEDRMRMKKLEDE